MPQPRFAAVRDAARGAHRRARDGRLPGGAEAGRLGRPARPLPARVARTTSSAHLHAALAESPTGRGDPRGVHRRARGERRCVVARGGEPYAADALRPAAARRATASASAGSTSTRRRSSATRSRRPSASRSRAVRALGLRDGIAFPQLIVSTTARRASSRSRRASRAGRWPTSRCHARRRRPRRDRAAAGARRGGARRARRRRRFEQPLAIRFLTAEPGPLPVGQVRAVERRSTASSRSRASSQADALPPGRARRSARCASTATAAAT